MKVSSAPRFKCAVVLRGIWAILGWSCQFWTSLHKSETQFSKYNPGTMGRQPESKSTELQEESALHVLA